MGKQMTLSSNVARFRGFDVRRIDFSLCSNSYPDVTLSKIVSHSSDPYDRAKEMLKVFLGLSKLDF